MPGIIVPVFARTDFNYTTTVAGAMAEFPIAQNIDVSQYRECTLLVRVHALSFANAGSKIEVRARRVAPTDEDPAQFFRDQTTSWTVPVTQGDTAPRLLNVTVGPNTGGWISVFLVVTQGSTGTTLTATLSADLSLKDD
jgi:hypothetical protein